MGLVSEIASPAFANRCLTFSHRPQWVQFDTEMTLVDKVRKLRMSDWGMNTNFETAMERILRTAAKAKLMPHEIPDLIVFSDMQFDEASSSRGSWETHHQRIVRRFKEEGMKVCGKAWPAPHMIYWNLRGDTHGFPAQADTPNVTMLSGFSPSLMKLLLDGDPLVNEVKVDKKDPFTTLRKALDDESYDKVRKVLSESREGLLKFYRCEALQGNKDGEEKDGNQ